MEEQQQRVRSKRGKLVENLEPYILSILCNIFSGAYNIASKVSLDGGMSRYVLVVYGHALGALTTAILALLFERNNESKLSVPVLRNIFFLGLLGAALGRTLFFAGLEYTSPSFASAMSNLIPSITFILAILCRMEKVEIWKPSAQAKILGTLVAFGGAILMSLYKGVVVISLSSRLSHEKTASTVDAFWMKGSILLFISFLSFAAFYILMMATIKKYPAPITLTSLICLVGTILAAILAAILDHKASSWRLSWDITLLAPIYGGVMTYGITIYLQLLIIRKKGPVFMTAFRPLSTVVEAIMGLFIFGHAIHLGGIVGATLIVVGLYAILWGKEKEKEKTPNIGA